MGISISEEEMNLCERLTRPAWIHVCLVNDLYSWEKEYQASQKYDKTQTFNAIWVLMREHSFTVDQAKDFCRQKIKENVTEYLRNVEENRNNENLSPDLRRYIVCMQYQLSGNLVWSRLCPRYNLAASFNESQLLRMTYGLKKYPIRSYEEAKAFETTIGRGPAIKSKTLINGNHPLTYGGGGVNGISHQDVKEPPNVNGTNGVLTDGQTPRAHQKSKSVVLDLNLHGLGDEVCITNFQYFYIIFMSLKGVSR